MKRHALHLSCLMLLAASPALLAGSREYPFVYENASDQGCRVWVKEQRNGKEYKYYLDIAQGAGKSANAGFKPGTPNCWIIGLTIDGLTENGKDKWWSFKENNPTQWIISKKGGKWQIDKASYAKAKELGLTR